MKKVFVTLGTLLAATSALIFLAGRQATERVNQNQRKERIKAADAAAMLAAAWSDHHTRA